MFENWFPRDMTTLRKLLWFRTAWEKSGKPPVPTDPLNTFVGSIVRFFSHRALPVVQLEANFTPIQDLNGQEAPWPPGGGVNKLAPSSAETITDHSITFKSDGNGTYTLSGTADGNANATFILDTPHTIQSGDYLHMMNSVAVGTFVLRFSDESVGQPGMSAVNRIFTPTNYVGKTLVSIGFSIPSGSTFNGTIQPMICTSSTAIPFSPYSNICPISGHTGCEIFDKAEYDPAAQPTVTVNFGQTVYGGKLTVFEDGSGQIVADRAMMSLTGEESWTINASYRMSTLLNPFADIDLRPNNICSHCKIGTSSDTFFCFNMSSSGQSLFFYNTGFQTTDAWEAYLAEQNTANTPVQVVYYIATPITIPLTPGQIQTLVGENVVWVNNSDYIQVTAYGSPID